MPTAADSLKKRVGEPIVDVLYELWGSEVDKPNLEGVYLIFAEANPFAFGCGGDGRVIIRRIKRTQPPDNSGGMPTFSGAIFHGFSQNKEYIVLYTSNGTIGIRNDGDELFLSIPATWDALEVVKREN